MGMSPHIGMTGAVFMSAAIILITFLATRIRSESTMLHINFKSSTFNL